MITVLLACTNLARRTLALNTEAPVIFYDNSFCIVDSCAEKNYDLANEDDNIQFKNNLKKLIQASHAAKKSRVDSRDMDEVIRFHLGHPSIAKGAALALELLQEPDIVKAAQDINEVFAAIKNNFRVPIDANFQFFYLPIEFFTRIKYNEVRVDHSQPDYLIDPAPSSFWRGSGSNDKKDLNIGFDRNQKFNYSKRPCNYDKPKAGFGVHPGFHILCGERKFKLKLGTEVHSSSFNARLYHALGYFVPTIDFIDQPTLRYDRKILTEFNSRRIEHFRVLLGKKTLFKQSNDRYYSPYDYIKEVILKNGIAIPARELKQNLFLNANLERPELIADNFNAAFEEQVALVVMVPASYILKTNENEIGAWRYDELSHENRRELRGLQLLAAWVGNFDMRMDNVRLVRSEENGIVRIKHLISDVGTGLGNSSFLLANSTSNIEEMPWAVTETYTQNADGYSDERLEIIGLMSIEVNKAFKKMTFADGQWMVNKLCQITESQLQAALQASGLSEAESALAFEKLISRRTKMVQDFKLESQLKSCIIKTNKKLSSTKPDSKGYQLKEGHLRKVKP